MSKRRLLVHAHIYYPELGGEIVSCLRNLRAEDCDVYVTTSEDPDQGLMDRIREAWPDAHLVPLENRGYDIGPFFEILSRVSLDDYDYVVKIHTKRDFPHYYTINGHNVMGPFWRQRLLSIVSDPGKLMRILCAMDTQQDLGMVGDYCFVSSVGKGRMTPYQERMLEEARGIMGRLGIAPQPEDHFHFVAGAMFIVRSDILKALRPLGLRLASFSVPDRSDELDLAHTMEYSLGWLVTSSACPSGANYRIYDPSASRLIATLSYPLRFRYVRKLLRFVCRVEYTSDFRDRFLRIFKLLKIRID